MNIKYEHIALVGVCATLFIVFLILVLRSDRVALLMRLWQQFLDSLDTAGGHIVLLMGAITVGLVGFHLGFSKADDIILGAGTILLQKLRSDGGKATPPDDTAKSAQ